MRNDDTQEKHNYFINNSQATWWWDVPVDLHLFSDSTVIFPSPPSK